MLFAPGDKRQGRIVGNNMRGGKIRLRTSSPLIILDKIGRIKFQDEPFGRGIPTSGGYAYHIRWESDPVKSHERILGVRGVL